MKCLLKFLLLLSPGLFALAPSAGEVSGLYQVVVPVQSQSTMELRKAAASGLQTIFVRVSGRADTLKQQDIRQAVAAAQTYLKQYSYKRERDAVDGSEILTVILEFERELVDGQLRVAGLPLWPANRPSILFWLAVDDGEGRLIAGLETSPEAVAAIQHHSTRRGLPINLPLLDLEDNIALSVDTLWAFKTPAIAKASSRYQSDILLFGKATRLSSGKWLGACRLSFEGRIIEFEVQADDLDAFVGRAVDRVAEQLGEQYAIVPVSIAQDEILMRLQGVRNFTDYARIVSYLDKLAAIRMVNVVSIDGETIVLRLIAEGQLQQLQQAIARDGLLLPVAATGLNEENILLNYQWAGSAAPEPEPRIGDQQ